MDLMMDIEHDYLHIVHALAFEAWKDIPLENLKKFGSDDTENVHHIVCMIRYCLAEMKDDWLRRSKELVTFPLASGLFGKFSNEVLEVVGIANLERIRHGRRFLCVQHLLSGFSRSRIADNVEEFFKQGGQNPVCEEDLEGTFPVYYIYSSSQDVAKALGCETIGLEHMFLAIIFGRRKGIIDEKQWKMIVGQQVVAQFLDGCKQLRAPLLSLSLLGAGNCESGSSGSSFPDIWSHFFPETEFETAEFISNAFKYQEFDPPQVCFYPTSVDE